jgi:prepilin-type N-terminal cleavage/methylation domain-containing protein
MKRAANDCVTRADRRRGFTLIEMMIVVSIIAVVGAVAVRIFSRGTRAERLPSTARDLTAHLHEARHAAISLGQTTRVTFNLPTAPGVRSSFLVERLNAPNSTSWESLGPIIQVPDGVEICDLLAGAVLTTAAPSCPFSSTAAICFQPTGRASLSLNGSCPGLASGATIALEDENGDTNKRKFKIVVWGLTGLPKLMDQW